MIVLKDNITPATSGSYPFMDIARDYGLDYGDVLCMADNARTAARRQPNEANIFWYREARKRIKDALGSYIFKLFLTTVWVTVRSYQVRLGNIKGDNNASI